MKEYKKVYVTGDKHSDFKDMVDFGKKLKEPSVIIITGDFGGIWATDLELFMVNKNAKERLIEEHNKLDKLSCDLSEHIILFCDGNHENFDRLEKLPVVDIFDGKAHKVRENIYHLMRGEIFNILGMSFFVFGGAYSHDIEGGLPNPYSETFLEDLAIARASGLNYRIKRLSWWKQEKPSKEEIAKGYEIIERHNKFDYIITHQTNIAIEQKLGISYDGKFGFEFHDFLRAIDVLCEFKTWFFGHYHGDRVIDDKHVLIYNKYIELTKNGPVFYE